jgi:methionyl aminopeptidase
MSPEEKINKMREGGKITVGILKDLLVLIRPGVTTGEIDKLAEQKCRELGVKPAFKGYQHYPSSICIGPEDIVVHGIPSDRVLHEGEIVSVDFGIQYAGVYLDMARTVPVGAVSEKTRRFLDTVEEAMCAGCRAAKIGNKIGDIGFAISSIAQRGGYSVVREMVGHGVGIKLHEEPMIPGYGEKGHGEELREGQTLAIEAIVNEGGPEIEISKEDGWTSRTKDGMLSALFEATVLVSEESEILTPF